MKPNGQTKEKEKKPKPPSPDIPPVSGGSGETNTLTIGGIPVAVATLSVQDVFGPRSGATPTVSTRATAGATPRGPAPTGEAPSQNGDLSRAFTVAATSNPLYGIAVLGLMLIGVTLLAQRVGTQEDFRSVRLSVFNVIVISLAAIVGINFWKVIFTRFPVPHITPAVLAV